MKDVLRYMSLKVKTSIQTNKDTYYKGEIVEGIVRIKASVYGFSCIKSIYIGLSFIPFLANSNEFIKCCQEGIEIFSMNLLIHENEVLEVPFTIFIPNNICLNKSTPLYLGAYIEQERALNMVVEKPLYMVE